MTDPIIKREVEAIAEQFPMRRQELAERNARNARLNQLRYYMANIRLDLIALEREQHGIDTLESLL